MGFRKRAHDHQTAGRDSQYLSQLLGTQKPCSNLRTGSQNRSQNRLYHGLPNPEAPHPSRFSGSAEIRRWRDSVRTHIRKEPPRPFDLSRVWKDYRIRGRSPRNASERRCPALPFRDFSPQNGTLRSMRWVQIEKGGP